MEIVGQLAIERANALQIRLCDDYRASQWSCLKKAVVAWPPQGHDPRVTCICSSGVAIAVKQTIPRPPKRPKPHVAIARGLKIIPEILKLVRGIPLGRDGWQASPVGGFIDQDIQEPVQLAQAIADDLGSQPV